MELKGRRVCLNLLKSMLVLPAVFYLCLFFFLAGFLGSIIISRDDMRVEPRHRLLESTEVDEDGSLPYGETGDSSIYPIPFQVLSWRPRALYFPNFATAAQCQSIIEIARSSLRPSTVVLREGETAESTKGLRSSSGTFIRASDDTTGILDYIEKKISRATMLPQINGESFNILRYEVGQRYVPHYDAFNAAEYGPQESQRVSSTCFYLDASGSEFYQEKQNVIVIADDTGQGVDNILSQVASFLLYLTNVEEGGETMFPYEVASDDNGSNTGTDYGFNGCFGLRVKPRQGDGLLFYSLFPNGTIDKSALHGSCPVIKGEKWVATKWIRDQVQW